MQNKEIKQGKKFDLDIPQNTTDLNLIMRKRMEGIDLQMKDFIHIMREFTAQADTQMEEFMEMAQLIHKNVNKVKQ